MCTLLTSRYFICVFDSRYIWECYIIFIYFVLILFIPKHGITLSHKDLGSLTTLVFQLSWPLAPLKGHPIFIGSQGLNSAEYFNRIAEGFAVEKLQPQVEMLYLYFEQDAHQFVLY